MIPKFIFRALTLEFSRVRLGQGARGLHHEDSGSRRGLVGYGLHLGSPGCSEVVVGVISLGDSSGSHKTSLQLSV